MQAYCSKIQIFYSSILIVVLLCFSACNTSEHVTKGEYLVDKVNIKINNDSVKSETLRTVVKQTPNSKFLGFWKFKLGAYYAVDTAKMNERIEKKKARLERKNERKKGRVIKRNKRRIKRARRQYQRKLDRYRKRDKDTSELEPRFNPVYYYPKQYSNTFREWLRKEVGEEPVILDTNKTNKTVDQMELLLKKLGYYYATVTDSTKLDTADNEAAVNYYVKTGQPYVIDTIIYEDDRQVIIKHINGTADNRSVALRKTTSKIDTGMLLNSKILDQERSRIAKSLLDDAFFGANKKLIYYKLDTSLGNYKAALHVGIRKRTIDPPNGKKYKKVLSTYKVSAIYFHLNDTSFYKENFKEKIEEQGYLGVKNSNNRFRLLDTAQMFKDKPYPKVLYNGRMIVKPKTLDHQNFLEYENWYKDYYVTRTFKSLNDLGVFRSITPVVTEDFDSKGNLVRVDYYLTPAKRQSFSIEPKATHSNAVLGVSASVNYVNKNLFRGAERFKFDISGGFQYQPPLSSSDNEQRNFGFNTFEFNPSMSLTIPTLLPFNPPKRSYPNTKFLLSYNYQDRPEYKRHKSTAAMSYIFYEVDKSRKHQFSPITFSINQIETSDAFDQRINELNDEFLKNRFIDHFVLGSEYIFKFSNFNLITPDFPHLFEFTGQLNFAGNLMRLANVGKGNTNDNGSYTIAGIPYAQFFRADADFRYTTRLNKKNTHSMNYRLQAGIGVPYGNSPSLPYEYSFYAGGANSIRAFPARSLGPGAFLDTINTASRIGDFRLTGTIEYRFDIISFLEGALFTDFGNIWLLEEDSLRANGALSKDFLSQISLGFGVGLRLDFDFFVFRLDVGVPLHNPTVPKGGRWIFTRGNDAYDQYKSIQSQFSDKVRLRNPFRPTFNIAIGYPF